MKTQSFYSLLAGALLLGFSFSSCQKDDSNVASLTQTATVAAAKDDETVDAISDKVEQDADAIADEIESNNFSSTKSGSDWGCVQVTVDRPDTVRFPKVITLTYDCMDTINGEIFGQKGVIKITVEKTASVKKLPWTRLVKRTVEFQNFMVITDSTSVTLNGLRTMSRKDIQITTYDNLNKLRYNILDTISANYTFAIAYNDTVRTMTRIVEKSRNAILHFEKFHNWHPYFFNDSIIMKGKVTGVNASGLNYSNVITNPIIINHCPYKHNVNVITKGTKEYTVGNNSPAVIKYSSDGCKTIIEITKDGETKTIERVFGRKFHRWW